MVIGHAAGMISCPVRSRQTGLPSQQGCDGSPANSAR